MKKIDMGKFILLVGKDATEIFDYYNVDEMHGLNRKEAQAEEVDFTNKKKGDQGNGVYIYGLTNYDPRDKKLTAKAPYKPFLFLNKKHFKKDFTDVTLANHEAMHMVYTDLPNNPVTILRYICYEMLQFITYTLRWISSNLAIPFWTVGHIHLSLNMYDDLVEILSSIGMNLIVAIGFYMEWREHKKNSCP